MAFVRHFRRSGEDKWNPSINGNSSFESSIQWCHNFVYNRVRSLIWRRIRERFVCRSFDARFFEVIYSHGALWIWLESRWCSWLWMQAFYKEELDSMTKLEALLCLGFSWYQSMSWRTLGSLHASDGDFEATSTELERWISWLKSSCSDDQMVSWISYQWTRDCDRISAVGERWAEDDVESEEDTSRLRLPSPRPKMSLITSNRGTWV
jgi:hypothetical protein